MFFIQEKIKPLFALPRQLELPPPYLGSATASSAKLLSQPNSVEAEENSAFPNLLCSPVELGAPWQPHLFDKKPLGCLSINWPKPQPPSDINSAELSAPCHDGPEPSSAVILQNLDSDQKSFKEINLSWISSAIFGSSG